METNYIFETFLDRKNAIRQNWKKDKNGTYSVINFIHFYALMHLKTSTTLISYIVHNIFRYTNRCNLFSSVRKNIKRLVLWNY